MYASKEAFEHCQYCGEAYDPADSNECHKCGHEVLKDPGEVTMHEADIEKALHDFQMRIERADLIALEYLDRSLMESSKANYQEAYRLFRMALETLKKADIKLKEVEVPNEKNTD